MYICKYKDLIPNDCALSKNKLKKREQQYKNFSIYADDRAKVIEESGCVMVFEGFLYTSSFNSLLIEYQTKGDACFKDLSGKFSFVLYDSKSDVIYGAIDEFSEKKLCYCNVDNGFAVSTSAKVLSQFCGVNEICKYAVGMLFTYNYICAPYTIFEGIKKLSSSQLLELKGGRLKIEKYPKSQPKSVRYRNYHDCESAVTASLTESVKKRLGTGDYKQIGLLLSGGIDSAVLCSILSEQKDITLRAYTASFKTSRDGYDESDAACDIAKACNVTHHVIEIDENEIREQIFNLLKNTDEPMCNRTYSVASLIIGKAAEICDCIFTGDGGDEIFWGYPSYRRLDDAQLLFRIISPFSFLLLKKSAKKILPKKLVSVLEICKKYPPEQLFLYNSALNAKKAVKGLCTEPAYSLQKSSNCWSVNKNQIDLVLGTQAAIRKWNDITENNDFIHFSPFLDRNVISVAESIPMKYKMNKKRNKIILRNIAYKKVPSIANLFKHGFDIPVTDWLLNTYSSFVDEITDKDFIEKQNIFNFEEIKRQKEIFISGKTDYENDAVKFMWDYFVFQVWYKSVMDYE